MDSTKDKNKKGKKKRDQELAFVDVAKTRTSLANWTGRTLGRRISIARTTSAASTMNVRATTRHDAGRNVTGMRMDGMNGGGERSGKFRRQTKCRPSEKRRLRGRRIARKWECSVSLEIGRALCRKRDVLRMFRNIRRYVYGLMEGAPLLREEPPAFY